MKNIDYGNVNITGGFWHEKQELNQKITIEAVYDRFYETGRISAFDFNVKDGGVEPHVFWDSDVAKWIEGAAMILRAHPDKALEDKIERKIDGRTGTSTRISSNANPRTFSRGAPTMSCTAQVTSWRRLSNTAEPLAGTGF